MYSIVFDHIDYLAAPILCILLESLLDQGHLRAVLVFGVSLPVSARASAL